LIRTAAVGLAAFLLVSASVSGLAAESLPNKPEAFPEDPGEAAYRVRTVRAAAGQLGPLIEAYAALFADDAARPEDLMRPWIIRHSQGDHWDLMLIYPVESWASYMQAERTAGQDPRFTGYRVAREAVAEKIAFSEDLFMRGPAHDRVAGVFSENGFAHIEVFHALPGRKRELIEQRRMENAYMRGIGKAANLIFVSDYGGDADAMTIGLYGSLQHFAAPPQLNVDQRGRVAREAGFASLDDIGLYLRKLIARHQDTLGHVIAVH